MVSCGTTWLGKVRRSAVTISLLSLLLAATSPTTQATEQTYSGREVFDEVLPHFGCFAHFKRGSGLQSVVGADLRAGSTILDVSERGRKLRTIKLTFSSNSRLTMAELARWLEDDVGATKALIEEALVSPESLRERSCEVHRRYELSQLLPVLYPNGLARQHVCTMLDELNYLLRYRGSLLSYKKETVNGKQVFVDTRELAYFWVRDSVKLPWKSLHPYAGRIHWSTAMAIYYFDQYLNDSPEEIIKALQKTEKRSKRCNRFYPRAMEKKLKREQERQEREERKKRRSRSRKSRPTRPEPADYYTGSTVINKILPFLNTVPHILVDGEYVPLTDPDGFKAGDTIYKLPYRSSGQPRAIKVTFDPDDVLSRNEVGSWLRNYARVSGSYIKRALG